MAESKKTETTQDTKANQQEKASESTPGGTSTAQANQAKSQGTATGVDGVRGEEGGQQTDVPGAVLPTATLDDDGRTDADRMVNPSPNAGAVLNPPINPTRDEDIGKPVYIPPPGSQNRELRKNLEKHAGAVDAVFGDLDSDSDKDSKSKK